MLLSIFKNQKTSHMHSISCLIRSLAAISFALLSAALFAQTCPISATPASPITAGSNVSLDAGFCPGPGANTLGYTTRTGGSDDVHVWSAVGGAPPLAAGAGPTATVTLNTPGTYTYRVNRRLGYLKTSPPPTEIVLYAFGDTDITLTVAAAAPDTAPDPFSFASLSNQPTESACRSNTVTISGINAPATITAQPSVSYSINGGALVTGTGAISNGQTIAVSQPTALGFSETVTRSIDIGGVSASFSCTTVAADTTPNPFAFDPQTGVARSSLIESNSQTITGIDIAVPISVTGGEYSISNSAFTSAPGTISSSQSVRVRHASSASSSTNVTTTLTIGGVAAQFVSTTAAADTVPNAFSFAPLTGVPLATAQTSAAQAITGIDAPAPISVTGGEYSIDGAAFVVTAGVINNGQSVRLRHVSATAVGSDVTTALTIGGVTGAFRSTTIGADTTPSVFTFTAQTDVATSTVIISNAQTITDINAPTPISVTGGEYAINSGVFTSAAGTVNNNDSVRVRHTSATAAATDTITTLTIGGVTAPFRSNTRAAVATQSPTVEIVEPVDADRYTAPANILVRVEVSDPVGTTVLRSIDVNLSGERRNATATTQRCIRPRAARCVVYSAGYTSVAAANYTLDAALTYLAGSTVTTAVAVPISLRVTNTVQPPPVVVGNIIINGATPVVVPGGDIIVSVKAVNATGSGVSDVALSWTISNSNVLSAHGKRADTRKAACVGTAPDAPSGGTLVTDRQGAASFQFKASCAAGGREITINTNGISPAVQQKFQLSGANQRANDIALLNQPAGSTIVASGPSALTAQVTDGTQSVAGAVTLWTLSPTTAGTLAPRVQTDENGRAVNTVTLAANTTNATLTLCIENRSVGCKSYSIKTAAAVLVTPAAAISTPLIQQSITGTRVQLNQMTTRLQQLRSEQTREFYNGLGVSMPGARVPVGSSGKEESTSADSDADGGDKAGQRNVPTKPWGFFSVGDIEISKKQGDAGFKVGTQGLTAGVDYRIAQSWVAGATLGYLRGETDLNVGGKQKASGYSAGLFAQWTPDNNAFANVVVNAGRGRYEISRFDTDGIKLSASPTSTQLGIQGELGYMWNNGGLRVQPYVRAELTRASVDAMQETGGPGAIAIDSQQVSATTIALGTVVDRTFSTASGVWIPSARLEMLNEARKQNDSFVRLVNGSAVFVPFAVEPIDKRFGTLAFNLQWLTGIGGTPISSFVGYERTFGKSGFTNSRITLGVKIPL
jgi:Autotransporter beta-domain